MAAKLEHQARRLLEQHWCPTRGFSVPNAVTYPHLWLWDSCFHAIIWAHLGDSRALRELDAVLAGQLPGGLVPHMVYGEVPPDAWLGPHARTSSLAQPPMFGHAIKTLVAQGLRPSASTIARASRGLDWLWAHRRHESDLIYVVHPWEAGNDHSPRWDDWGAPGRTRHDYDRHARTAWNKALMGDVTFDADGAAAWSTTFVACPAGFNAYVAYNMAELADVLGESALSERASRISAAMDDHLWDAEQGLWSDLPLVGGGPSVHVPISDGVMGALVTADGQRARTALAQTDDPDRFGSPCGPSNVARTHPAYDPVMYWRGVAWPHLSYLLRHALLRWGCAGQAEALTRVTRTAAVHSGWAEYWSPETGEGLGAIPQSWTGLVAAMEGDDR